MNHYVDINNLTSFISIHNTNRQIITKYNTQLEKDPLMIFISNTFGKDDVSVTIHQVQIPKKIRSQKGKSK